MKEDLTEIISLYRYPSWFNDGFKILNQNSTFYDTFTRNAKQCLLKSVCLMARNRQLPEKSLKHSIYKSARYFIIIVIQHDLVGHC